MPVKILEKVPAVEKGAGGWSEYFPLNSQELFSFKEENVQTRIKEDREGTFDAQVLQHRPFSLVPVVFIVCVNE